MSEPFLFPKNSDFLQRHPSGRLPGGPEGPHNTGEPPGGDMEARVRELEKGHAVVIERLSALDRRMDDGFKAVNGRFDDVNRRFDDANRRFDDLGRKIDKLPNEWAMARVVFYVTAALMAAAFFGPRLAAMIQPALP